MWRRIAQGGKQPAAWPSVERAEPNQTKSISRPRQIRNHLLTPWQYIDFTNTGAANVQRHFRFARRRSILHRHCILNHRACTMNRQTAIDLLAALPLHEPSADNRPDPELWAAWCSALGRDPAPSYVWTELDVVRSAVLHLNSHVFKSS
jgi:hypothetical protein